MGAPTVYKSTDTGAPSANQSITSLNDILYACLVTGYGSKAAAGWTQEYINGDGSIGSYRNNPTTGTGMYLQVDQSNVPTNYYAQLKGYETMTDFDSGLGLMNASNIIASTGTGTITNRAWILIADDRAFYYMCWRLSSSETPTAIESEGQLVFFGDLESEYDPDPYGCAICGYTGYSSGSYLTSLSAGGTATSNYKFVARYTSGVDQNSPVTQIYGTGVGNTTYMGTGGPTYNPPTAPIYVSRGLINDGAAWTFRGYLPGLYYPCHAYPLDNMEEVTVDGIDFIGLNVEGASNNRTQPWIRIDDGFRP